MHGSEKWRLRKLSKRNKQWFGVFHTVFEHFRIVSSDQKNVRALDCFSCCKIFLRAGNNPVVLKNSTEHAEQLFIALTKFVLTCRFYFILKCYHKAENEKTNENQ